MVFKHFHSAFFSVALLFAVFSCQSSSNQFNVDDSVEQYLLPEPDSTLFFDSLYAPLAFQLDTFFLNKHKNGSFYGTVLFAQRGRVIFTNAYGYAHIKNKDTLTTEHTFQLASASKPFTAVAILQLYEKGKLHLSDNVKSFIPNFPYDSITIHQLLCHRSGMSQYTHFCDRPDSIWPNKSLAITNADVLEIMSKNVPMINYPPNHTHYYCNTNYLVLASIIEVVSGYTFENYLQKFIFSKVNMNATRLYNKFNKDSLYMPVTGYTGNFVLAGDTYLNGVVGDKGVYSNVTDLLKFDQALYSGLLLNTDTLSLAFGEHNELQKNNQNYGYGFRLYPNSAKGKIVFHTGWWEGFRTYFIRIPQSQQTIIVLTHIKKGPFLDVMDLVNLLP